MTIKEFFKSKEKLTIHCKTEEQSNILLKMFDEEKQTLDYYGTPNKEINYFEIYKEKTCYSNELRISSIEWFYERSYTIIEFENIENYKIFDETQFLIRQQAKIIEKAMLEILNITGETYTSSHIFKDEGFDITGCTLNIMGFNESKIDFFKDYKKEDNK